MSPSVAAAARVSAPAVNVRRSRALGEDVLGSRLTGFTPRRVDVRLGCRLESGEPRRLSGLYAGQDIRPRELVLGYVSKDRRERSGGAHPIPRDLTLLPPHLDQ
jgi:hypothetical protein